MRPPSSAPRQRPAPREVSSVGRSPPHRVRAEDGGARVMPRRGGVAGVAVSMPPLARPPCVWHRALTPRRDVGGGGVRQGHGRAVPAHPHEDVEAGSAVVSTHDAHGASPVTGAPSRRGQRRRAPGGLLSTHLASCGPVVARGRRADGCRRHALLMSHGIRWGEAASQGRRWSPTRAQAQRGETPGSAGVWPRGRRLGHGSPGEAWAVRGTESHGGGRRQVAHLTNACT